MTLPLCHVPDQYCPRSATSQVAARRLAPTRLLWLDEGVPTPDKDSGSVRSLWLLRILVQEHYTVVFQPRIERDIAYTYLLRFHGVLVQPVVQPDQIPIISRSGACLYAAFIISRPEVYALYAPIIKSACPFAPLIYDTVDVHFLREARGALSAGMYI